ncbi:MAG: hypothetical protein LUD74_04070, partial [Tannerellaceae bacterium]|nr:hypothetical protein [Tannerellaceae bacterium]
KKEYLNLLPYAEWEYNGKVLKTASGIHLVRNSPQKGDQPFENYELANITDKDIINTYEHHFVTLNEGLPYHPGDRKKIPEELAGYFPEDLIEESLEPLAWIKITLPPNFDDYILDNFFATLNAFPVANKKLYSTYFKTTSTITSVIPLETETGEYFLDVHSVTNGMQEYMPLPYLHSDTTYHKTYIVKKGGVERFDPRDAKEYISYLIDLLREEGSAFSMIGKGFVDELVKKMEELIASIEKKLEDIHTNKEIASYLVLDVAGMDETIFVDYWVTDCERANDIKAGSVLASYNETYVVPESIVSLTQSKGGRHISRHQSLDKYKYILTSRNHIYTDEDITNFCFAEFKDLLADVAVKKGVAVSPRPKEGLIRTIDVYLHVRQQIDQLSTREYIHDRLLRRLQEQSPESYNYRVFITQP